MNKLLLTKNNWNLSVKNENTLQLHSKNFTQDITIPEADIKNLLSARFGENTQNKEIPTKHQEIEYKFLLKPEQLWKNEKIESVDNYKQLYLIKDDSLWQARLRIINDLSALITIKGPKKGLSGAEFEYDFPVDVALKLWDEHPGVKLEKRRYVIQKEDDKWEIDEFLSPKLKGLFLAELEVKDVNQKITLPEWLGKEVTEDRNYKNDRIADYNLNLSKNENSIINDDLLEFIHRNGSLLPFKGNDSFLNINQTGILLSKLLEDNNRNFNPLLINGFIQLKDALSKEMLQNIDKSLNEQKPNKKLKR